MVFDDALDSVLSSLRNKKPLSPDDCQKVLIGHGQPAGGNSPLNILRENVTDEDLDAIVYSLHRSTEDRHEPFRVAIHLLQGLYMTSQQLEVKARVRGILEGAWLAARAEPSRGRAVAAALTSIDGLAESMHEEIFRFLVDTWEAGRAYMETLIGGADKIASWIGQRLQESRWPSSKRWVYVLALGYSSDKEAVWEIMKKLPPPMDDLTERAAAEVKKRLGFPYDLLCLLRSALDKTFNRIDYQMNYFAHLLVYFDVYVIVALSLNLVVGYCGMLTLAHAGYYAIGGYTYALLALVFGWGFLAALVLVILIAVVLSLALSLPAWRLKGDFFLLASLAVQTLIFSVLYNWSDPSAPIGSLSNLTNGPFGIPNIPKAEVLGVQFASSLEFCLLASVIAALCALIVWRLKASPWGRVLIAMREDELVARGLGKNTRLLKVQAIAISAGMVAVAGALYAAYISFIEPGSASLEESILMLSMVIVGGVGNFRGPVVGALVLLGLPEVLRLLQLPDAQAANVRLAVYGVLLVLMMHVRPQELSGEYRVK